MINIRNTALGDFAPSPALVRLVLLALVVLVLASFQLVAVAQEGDGEGGVGGKADHECDDNPSLATCPAPPPTRLSLTINSSGGGDDFTVSYSRSTWSGSSSHRYRFELHRATSSSGSYTLYRSAWDGISPVYFSNVDGGYTYKARARRCRTYSTSTCGGYSSWSNTRTVSGGTSSTPPAPQSLSLSLSNDDFTLTWSRSAWSGSSYHYYVFELHRSSSRTSGFTSYRSVNDSLSSTPFSNVTRDRYYKARGKRCTSSSRTTCGSWSSWSSISYVGPPPPSSLSLSVSSDDLTLTWSRSYMSGSSSHYYVFELHRATSSRGSYSRYSTLNDTRSSTSFNNVTTSRYYKARGKRCTTSNRSVCGDWSSFTPSIYVSASPPPPTSLSLSRSDDDFTLTWSRSSWTGSSSHYYVFELHRATSSSGSYSRYSTVNDTSSSTSFSNVTRERYYKARGKRCTTSSRSTCGAWSSWSSNVYVPASPPPPTGLSLSISGDDATVTYSRSSWTGSSSHYYVFEMHRSTRSSGSYSRASTVNDTSSPVYFNNLSRGYWYKARGKRCTTSSRTTCGNWSSWSAGPRQVLELPGRPSSLSLSKSTNDLTLTYSPSSWSGGTGNYYKFELRRSTSRNGSYGSYSSANDPASPLSFSNVARGYWYKARGTRCTDSARADCAAWTSLTSTGIEVPTLPGTPSNLSLSRSADDLTLTYSPSSWSGGTGNYYKFELQRSTSRTGSYGSYESANDSASPLSFTNVARGYWYKARGTRCTDSARTDCATWTSLTSTGIEVPTLPGTPSNLSLSRSTDDLTLTYSPSSWPGGTGNYYKFEFQRATTHSGSYSSYRTANDTASPLSANDVARGYWYKARGTRCTDSARTDCASWTSLTSTGIEVPTLPAAPSSLALTRSTDDLTLTYSPSRWSGGTGNYYKFELQQATTSSGSYSSYRTSNDEATPLAFDDVKRGRWYKVRGTRCTDSARSDCADWTSPTSAFQVPSLPNPPTMGAASVSGDDLSVAYTASTWSEVAGNYYEFEAHKSTTQSGSYTRQSTTDDDASPVAFSDLSAGWYKVRGRRCIDSDRTECGTWSGYSDAVQVAQSAPPPTALSLSLDGDNDIELTYSRSSWTGHSSHHYEFELLRSESSSGTFSAYDDDDDSASPLDFDDVHTGYYYKARGKRCASSGTRCGDWSRLSSTLTVPAKTYAAPTLSTPTVPGNEDEMQVVFTRSTVSSLSDHHYVFELHRADSATGTFAKIVTESAETSPATFDDIDRSKVYKARGKRCKTDSGKVCGQWSNFTSVWDAPSPPSSATLSLTNQNTLSATYTRSTTPAASTHYYQFKLIRSETATGTYVDYGDIVKTTSTVAFGTVHTGYHYKAMGRRCQSSNANCGQWSSQTGTSAVAVPVTAKAAPSAPTATVSTEGDDITVNLSSDADDGTSGQAVDPDPTPDVSYYVAELRRSMTSSGPFSFYSSSDASATSATFTDVQTGWYYTARVRACAAAVRKLCGSWSSESAALNVPVPPFPTLTVPTVKPSGNGVLRAELHSLSTAFDYVMTLESSETGKSYTKASSQQLTASATSWDFSGLDPTAELLYVVTLKACAKGSTTACGNAVRAPPIRIPVILLSSVTLSDFGLGLTRTFSVSANYLPVDRDFKFVASTTSTGADANKLKFASCSGATAANSQEARAAGRASSAGPFSFVLLACATGSDLLTVKLMSGPTAYHALTKSAKVTPVPKPTNVIANGDTPSTSTSIAGNATFRFNPISSVTEYGIKYVNVVDSLGRVRDNIQDSEIQFTTVSAPTSGDLTLTETLLLKTLYRINLRAVRNGFPSEWSEDVYVFPTRTQVDKSKVGDIPLQTYLPSGAYEYTICSDDVDAALRGKWIADIERGIAKWANRVSWNNSLGNNVVTSSRASTPSACLKTATEPWRGTTEIRILGTNQQVMLACGNIPSACVNSIRIGSTQASEVGLSERTNDLKPYMIFNGTETWNPGTVASGKSCSKVENFAVHETGHVFGLNDITSSSAKAVSMMYTRYDLRHMCTPTQQDIAAVMTIYQSERSP